MDYGPKFSMHSQQPSTNNQSHLIMDPLCHLPNKKKTASPCEHLR